MQEGEIKPKNTSKKITIPVIVGNGVPYSSPHVVRLSKNGSQLVVDTTPFPKQKSRASIDLTLSSPPQFTQGDSFDTLLKRPQSKKTPALPEVNFFHKDALDAEIKLDESGFIEDAIARAITEYEYEVPENVRTRQTTKKIKELPHPSRTFKAKSHFTPHKAIAKTIAMFGVAALAVTFPIHAAHFIANANFTGEEIRKAGTSALMNLTEAGNALAMGNTPNAHYAFNDAEHSFDTIKEVLTKFDKESAMLANAIPGIGGQVKSAKALTEVARETTAALSKLSESLSMGGGHLSAQTIAKPLREAVASFTIASKTLENVDVASLPSSIRQQVGSFKETFNEVTRTVTTLSKTLDTWNTLLAHNPSQTVLFIFQNSNEIRATGGFWGSFAIVKIKNGAVEDFFVPGGGTYDLQGSLDRRLKPPAPLQLVKNEWQFQDANWFADFPESARTAIWFLEHSGYQTPDAVVAITPAVLTNLLTITGPIELPTYNKTLTAENVIDELQNSVENEYDRTENKPKKIIGDMMTILVDRLTKLKGNDMLQATALLYDSLSQKDILLYHQNTGMQQLLTEVGWDGSVNAQWKDDYLMVVNSNIAGQKTDKVMTQDIIKDTTIHENGGVTTTLTIRRTHTGTKGAAFTGVRNVNFMRVMVPEGAELLSATGFTYPDEKLFKVVDGTDTLPALAAIDATTKIDDASGTKITTEQGKTVFGNWTMTDPGQTTVVKITYQLPFHILPKKEGNPLVARWQRPVSTYSSLIQTQPGTIKTLLTTTLHIPNSWKLVASTDTNGDLVETTPLKGNILSGVVATTK